jgi:type II secretion system protein J
MSYEPTFKITPALLAQVEAIAATRCSTSIGIDAALALAIKVSDMAASAMLMPPDAEPVIPASELTDTAALTSGFGMLFSASLTLITDAPQAPTITVALEGVGNRPPIAGDVQTEEVRAVVEKLFGGIPRGPEQPLVMQAEPRPVREPLGESLLPAVLSGDSVDYKLQLTRAGWSNTAGLARSSLQRIGYRLDQDGLWRDHWPVLDHTLATEPTRRKLLGGVRAVTFRFMDANRNWVERWPMAEGDPQTDGRARPAAIEVTLDLEDWGTLRRVVEVAG